MKVAEFRKMLSAIADLQEGAARRDVASTLRKLTDALQPADAMNVAKVVEKLSK